MREDNVETFVIDSESGADAYLNDMLKNDNYRSIDEVQIRAEKYIKDPIIKEYFIAKAEIMLQVFR